MEVGEVCACKCGGRGVSSRELRAIFRTRKQIPKTRNTMDFILNLAMMGPADGQAGQQSSIFMVVWLGLMVAVFYFMLIRPQKRREKERQALLAAVKTGDRVLFAGGLLGVVANVKDKVLVVKIADGVKIEVLRGAISQVLTKGEDPAEEKAQ